MALTFALREEIEGILRASSPGLTHGEMFRYIEQGLDEEEIIARDGTGKSNVRNFVRSVQHLLDGTLPESQSAARTNAMVYKELLNHELSPGLRSYVTQQLTALKAINPSIDMRPLQTRSRRYPVNRVEKKASKSTCARCNLEHAG